MKRKVVNSCQPIGEDMSKLLFRKVVLRYWRIRKNHLKIISLERMTY